MAHKSNKAKDKVVFNGSRFLEMKKDFENDCSGYEYIPDTIERTSTTIAIGDIHGDLEVAIKVLELANCIKKVSKDTENSVTLKNNDDEEEHWKWIGGDTQVVQVGDQVDRCRPIGDHLCVLPDATVADEASDIKILKFYTAMNKEARKDGGRLISLLGNHEIMNVSGRMQYVSFLGLLDFSPNVDLTQINSDNINDFIKYTDEGLKKRRDAFTNNAKAKRDEPLNEFLACTRQSAIIVGDLLFVHGGVIQKLAETYNIDDINTLVRKWLLGKLDDEINLTKLLKTKKERKLLGGYGDDDTDDSSDVKDSKKIIKYKERLKMILSSGSKGISPFWNRLLGNLPADIMVEEYSEETRKDIESRCDNILNPVFETFNIGGIVVGHTPQMTEKYGINSACNKRIWRTDIGASKAFNMLRSTKRRIEVLKITYPNDVTSFEVLKYKL
jgi:hypothetical protein